MIDTLSAVTRERLRRFMRIVRMAAIIGAGSGAVYAGAIAGPGARSLLVSLLILVLAVRFFRRTERTLADII